MFDIFDEKDKVNAEFQNLNFVIKIKDNKKLLMLFIFDLLLLLLLLLSYNLICLSEKR